MDGECMDRMIRENLNLVRYAIRRYLPGMEYDEDVFQSGMIGLWKALLRWDPERGKLATIAVPCIRNEICMEMRRRMLPDGVSVVSLDDPAPDSDGELSVGDCIADPEDRYGPAEYDLRALPAGMPELELRVLRLRAEGYLLDEIGKMEGFSRQYASAVAIRARSRARRLCARAVAGS